MKSMFNDQHEGLPAATKEIFSMATKTYSNSFAMIAPRMAVCHRHHEWPTSLKEEVDTLGPFWGLATFPYPLTNFSFWANGKKLPVGPNVAVFVPPYSVFSAYIGGGAMDWLAIFSDLPLPATAPTTPVMLPWTTNLFEKDLEGLMSYVEQQKNHWINIEKRSSGSRLALKARLWINQNFRSECNLKELADQLEVDQSVLGRDFKACYGISPSVYRKKIRTTTAMLSIVLEGFNVTEAATQVGYGDLDHFTKQFRSNLLALPSQFKPPKEFY
jgi:AraC-like DNA-binding protein